MKRHSRVRRVHALEREVEKLIAAEQYALAVIVSQTLLELRIAAEVDNILEGYEAASLGDGVLVLLGSYNLANGKTRKFFEAVLGERLNQVMGDEMRALDAHNFLRNKVIHEGAEANEQEARDSFEAVKEVSWKIHQLTYRLLGLDDDLEVEEGWRREEEGWPPED